MLVLRFVYAFHLRFDTDEPQHLHVVWGWAHGHLQYRDVFDNHGPVFHLLCVPLFRALGERPDILIPMRLAMLPLLAVSLWAIYRIGAALFSPRVGLWAAIFTGLYPEFFFTSTEFRTDDLWLVLWLVTLVIVTGPNFTGRRAFAAGLVLGTAFCVTAKTGLMVGALCSAAAVIVGREWIAGKGLNSLCLLTRAGAAILGLAIVPSLFLLFFASRGATKEFLYCNITHNLVGNSQNWEELDPNHLWLPVFLVVILGVFWWLRNKTFDPLVLRRIFLALVAGFYFSALKTLFPTLSRQDDLPFIPLCCLMVAFLLTRVPWTRVTPRNLTPLLAGVLPISLAMTEALTIVIKVPFWHDQTKHSIAMVADVLRSTKSTDYVMDATGETIFRPRPYYYALEAFTKARIAHGLIEDDIAQQLVKTRTAVVRQKDLTKLARAFVQDNYVNVGNELSMLGKVFKPEKGDGSNGTFTFNILIPARYVVINADKTRVSGTLDGTPIAASQILGAGSHVLSPDGGLRRPMAVFWADAFEKGFSPLAKD